MFENVEQISRLPIRAASCRSSNGARTASTVRLGNLTLIFNRAKNPNHYMKGKRRTYEHTETQREQFQFPGIPETNNTQIIDTSATRTAQRCRSRLGCQR